MTTEHSEGCFIAIDSGGTNTRGWVCDKAGNTLKRYLSSGANPKDIGWDKAFAIFKHCILDLLEGDLSKLECLCITAAGIGDVTKDSSLFWGENLAIESSKIIIVGDAYAAHLGAFAGQDGVMVVAGTGTALVGRKGQQAIRLGGWGHILGDQGSGYAIGLAGIREAVMASDLGQTSALLQAVKKTYNISSIQQLLEHIHASAKAEVAKFAKDVLNLAAQGDAKSQTIIEEQVAIFPSFFKRFAELGYPPKLSYIGGLFEHPYYLQTFTDLVNKEKLELHAPKLTALEAAMQIALGEMQAFNASSVL